MRKWRPRYGKGGQNMTMKPEIIRKIREKTTLSRSEFADLLGVTENYLYRVESGMRKPSMKLLEAMAELSGVTVRKLTDIAEEPDEAEAERAVSAAHMYIEAITKLRHERHNRKDLEMRNAALEHALEHLWAVVQLHQQFDDIVCQEALPHRQKQQKLEELAKATAEEGEVTFNEMLAIFRVKRAVLKSWLKSGQRTYKCMSMEDREVIASTPGEAALRLCCFDCEYHESRECTGYGNEPRPENLIALLARMEANGIYNRTEQSRLLEESFGIKMSPHQISETVYCHRYGHRVPEKSFHLEVSEEKGKKK